MDRYKQRLFVDMDGTLAVFTPVDELEMLYEKGYFLNQVPHNNVIAAVKEIIANNPDIEVNILSAYLTDSKYALQEKNDWLDLHLPEIEQSHRIFVPCGSNKKEGIIGGIRNDDFLLDDYTCNLNDWQPPARGVKLLNDINHTRGSWEHDRIRYNRAPTDLANGILSIMHDERRIFDEKIGKNENSQKTINTNMGEMPLEDYLDMRAAEMGFEYGADGSRAFSNLNNKEQQFATVTKEAVIAANVALSNSSHFMIGSSGYSKYVGGNFTNAILAKEEAEKAISLGIHVGIIADHEEYHGSHQDEYSFAAISEKKGLDNYDMRTRERKLSIDPAYEYPHIGEKAMRISDMKTYVQEEMEKDKQQEKTKTVDRVSVISRLDVKKSEVSHATSEQHKISSKECERV